MSGETYLCEICGFLLEWNSKIARWVDELQGQSSSNAKYPHQHRPYGETPRGEKVNA